MERSRAERESGRTMLGKGHSEIRRVRSLRRERAARDAEGVLLAEGTHVAQEAIAAGADIERAFVSPRLERVAEGKAIRQALLERGILIRDVTDSLLESLQDARSPQPVLLVVRRPRPALDDVVPGRPGVPLLLVAWAVQDPGNLGAMVRTADAAGATGFVACGDGVDLHHPRAVRGSMGSIFRLPATALPDGEALFPLLKMREIVSLGAAPRARQPYHACDLRGPAALFVGREGAGLPPPVLARLGGTLAIPMHAGVESLSVSAAAAILLFEARRQRG